MAKGNVQTYQMRSPTLCSSHQEFFVVQIYIIIVLHTVLVVNDDQVAFLTLFNKLHTQTKRLSIRIFCDCQMLHLAGSYDPPNVTYVLFGVMLCLAATPV